VRLAALRPLVRHDAVVSRRLHDLPPGHLVGLLGLALGRCDDDARRRNSSATVNLFVVGAVVVRVHGLERGSLALRNVVLDAAEACLVHVTILGLLGGRLADTAAVDSRRGLGLAVAHAACLGGGGGLVGLLGLLGLCFGGFGLFLDAAALKDLFTEADASLYAGAVGLAYMVWRRHGCSYVVLTVLANMCLVGWFGGERPSVREEEEVCVWPG
jgi:hypothetical protein